MAPADPGREGVGDLGLRRSEQARRVDWTITKRTVADQRSTKTISTVYVLKREGTDTAGAADEWDDDSWDELSARHVELARDLGVLSELPLALNSRIVAVLFQRVRSADPMANLQVTIPHPFFGALNWRETLLFIRLHDLDHAGQLAKVAGAF